MSEEAYVYFVVLVLIGSAVLVAWLATQAGKEHRRRNIEMQRTLIAEEIRKNFTKGSEN